MSAFLAILVLEEDMVVRLVRPPKLAGVHGDRWTVRLGISVARILRKRAELAVVLPPSLQVVTLEEFLEVYDEYIGGKYLSGVGGIRIPRLLRLRTGGPHSHAKSSVFSEEKPHCFALSFSAFDRCFRKSRKLRGSENLAKVRFWLSRSP